MNLEQSAWIAAVVSVPVAVAGAVVAVFARRDAKRSAGAAERSAKAAEELTAIEQRRRHEELTPRLSVDVTCWGPGSSRLRVTVRLVGPDGLDRLDEVRICIRDDRERSPVIAGGPTQEQIAATIWGPYRFVPGVDGADQLGRTLPAFRLVRGESQTLVMEPSLSPSWVSTPGWWSQEYADQPIRLEATCVRAGEPPWRIPIEVEQPQPQFTAEARRIDRAIEVLARNTGTAPARQVRFSPPSNDPTAAVKGDEASILEIGHSISAYVFLVDQSTATWVELVWIDQLGVPQRQRVELPGR